MSAPHDTTPYDRYGILITVGTEIYFPTAKGGAGNGPAIRRGTVTAIEAESHRGYGYWTRRLRCAKPEPAGLSASPIPPTAW
jgi:hypothetical protein